MANKRSVETAPATPVSAEQSRSDAESDNSRFADDPAQCRAPLKKAKHLHVNPHHEVPKFKLDDDIADLSEEELQQVCEINDERDPRRAKLNEPIQELNKQMNLYMPPIRNNAGTSLIAVKVAVSKGNRYVNVKYNGLPQKYLLGTGKRLFKFSLMSPFGRVRYVDPLPFGSVRNRWNDPQSQSYRVSKFTKALIDSQLQYQLTNERLTEDELDNAEMNAFFDYVQDVEEDIFDKLLCNLDKFFPAIHGQIKKELDEENEKRKKDGLKEIELTKETLRPVLRSRWKGIVQRDSDNASIRYIQFAPRLFRAAKDEELDLLKSSNFQCRSKEDEITELLKISLKVPLGDTKTVCPRVDNDLNMFRCLSNKERELNPEGSPFVHMSFNEEKELFAEKSSITSVAFEISLGTNDTKISLRHDHMGLLWLSDLRLFEKAPELTGASKIRFNCL